MLNADEKAKKEAFAQKEKAKVGNYFDYREKKMGHKN